jgi:hypothetical protein
MASFNPGKAISRAFTLPGLPAIPEIKIPPPPDIIMPTPENTPLAPLTPSQTAARQRARSGARREGGASSLVLTSPAQRRMEDRQDLVVRTTLLGR